MQTQPVASFCRRRRREARPDLCLTDEMTRLPSPTVTFCLPDRGEMKVAATTNSPPNLFQSKSITSPLIEICAPKCASETCVPMARWAGRCQTTGKANCSAKLSMSRHALWMSDITHDFVISWFNFGWGAKKHTLLAFHLCCYYSVRCWSPLWNQKRPFYTLIFVQQKKVINLCFSPTVLLREKKCRCNTDLKKRTTVWLIFQIEKTKKAF